MSNKCLSYSDFNPMGNMLPFDNRSRAPACGTIDQFNSVSQYKILPPDYKSGPLPYIDMEMSMPQKPMNPYYPNKETFYYGPDTSTTEKPQPNPYVRRVGDTLSHIFSTQPVTTSAPDTVEFAKFLYPDPARCRNTGYLCKSNVDTTINHDRMEYYPNDKYYQTINNNYNTNSMLLMGSHSSGGVYSEYRK